MGITKSFRNSESIRVSFALREGLSQFTQTNE